MQIDIEILTELLSEFHHELKTCMENKQHDKLPDPILLGDFIVDTYNRYLAAARSACEHPLIQTMPEIEKLGEAGTVDYDAKKGVGSLPQLSKMREVAMATKQLQTILEGGVEIKADEPQREIAGVVTLLENLGEQIGQVYDEFHRDPQTESSRPSLNLVMEYNRYLAVVLEATDDSVIPKMFRPLEEGDKVSTQARLSEVKLAQSGLLSYLSAMAEC